MFNLKDLQDMSKLASEAKDIQRKQDMRQSEQTALLTKISVTLDSILVELKRK